MYKRQVCGEDAKGEREFCGVVLEAIAEVHDTIMGDPDTEQDTSATDDSFHSATEHIEDEDGTSERARPKNKKAKVDMTAEEAELDEQKAIREIVVNMKCLHIALCMLQNVKCDLGKCGTTTVFTPI